MRTPNTAPRFTLIELLVVIAIIAILASMLLPALAGAKDRAKQAQCLSSQKQVMVGVAMYMDDKDERGPTGGSQNRLWNPPGVDVWASCGGQKCGWAKYYRSDAANTGWGRNFAEQVHPYVGDRSVFYCVAYGDVSQWPKTSHWQATVRRTKTTSWITPNLDPKYDPAETGVIFDAVNIDTVGDIGGSSCGSDASGAGMLPHGRSGSVVFLDGHGAVRDWFGALRSNKNDSGQEVYIWDW